MERPICQETKGRYGRPCIHPAKFIWEPENKLVCGLHARAYTANSLHPFRMQDYEKNRVGSVFGVIMNSMNDLVKVNSPALTSQIRRW